MHPRHLLLAWLGGLATGLACEPTSRPNCNCFSASHGLENDCESPTLCATIVVDCADDHLAACPKDQVTIDDPGTVDCALTVLIAGDPGRLSWQVDGEVGYRQVVSLDIADDGTAYRWGSSDEDLAHIQEAAVHLELESTAYFQACAALTTPAERFVCMRDGQVEQPLKVCQEAQIANDGEP